MAKAFIEQHRVSPIYLNSSNEPTVNVAGSVSLVNSAGVALPINGFNIGIYDYVVQTRDTLTDTWVFKTGGASGTVLATITITYTTSAKTVISTVIKT